MRNSIDFRRNFRKYSTIFVNKNIARIKTAWWLYWFSMVFIINSKIRNICMDFILRNLDNLMELYKFSSHIKINTSLRIKHTRYFYIFYWFRKKILEFSKISWNFFSCDLTLFQLIISNNELKDIYKDFFLEITTFITKFPDNLNELMGTVELFL